MMSERRGFFKSMLKAGLGGAAVVAAPATVAVVIKEEQAVPQTAPIKEDISHLAPPEGAHTIQIVGSYGEPKKQEYPSLGSGVGLNSYVILSSPVQTHSVSMTVGKDNRLWIKVGDEWRRVALEA